MLFIKVLNIPKLMVIVFFFHFVLIFLMFDLFKITYVDCSQSKLMFLHLIIYSTHSILEIQFIYTRIYIYIVYKFSHVFFHRDYIHLHPQEVQLFLTNKFYFSIYLRDAHLTLDALNNLILFKLFICN